MFPQLLSLPAYPFGKLLKKENKKKVHMYSLPILFQGKQEERGMEHPFMKV